MQAVHRVYDTKYDILTQPKPAGSPERAKEIEDLLFDQYLMSTRSHTNDEKDKVGDEWQDKLLDKYGLDEAYDPNTHYDVDTELSVITVPKMGICRENLVTDIEVMMSTEEGIRELKRLYLPEIRKTKLYNDLLTSEGTEYEDLHRQADKETRKGLQAFKNVRLKPLAKPVNDRNHENLEKGFKKLETVVDSYAIKAVRNMQEFHGYDKASMKNNVEHLGYINRLINHSMMSDKSLPQAAKQVIADMKKAVKTLVNYAKTLSKKKESITVSDMALYDFYANDIKKLADGYTTTQEMPSEGNAKHVYLGIKRVGFMAKVNSDLVTYPARLEERKANMQEAMADRDEARVAAYRGKHPGADTKSADFKYAVLSNKALKTLRNAVLDAMKESEEDASASRKIMTGRAKEAVRNLTVMISKGEDHVAANQEEAKRLLRDIYAERIKARFDEKKVGVQEGERTIPLLTEEMPDFQEATKKITIGTIGTFLFENQADKLLDKYDFKEITTRLNKLTGRKREEDFAKIAEIEKKSKEGKNEIREEKSEIREEKSEIREEKNENRIIEEPLNVIHEEPLNVIHEEPENKNRINLEPDESEKEKQYQASVEALKAVEEEMTKNSVQDSGKAAQMKDTLPVPDKKKKKKGEPKKLEEPEQPKEEYLEIEIKTYSDMMVKEPPKEEVKEAPKEEPQKIEEDQKPVPGKNVNPEDEKNRINDAPDIEEGKDVGVKIDPNSGFQKLVNQFHKDHPMSDVRDQRDTQNQINHPVNMENRINNEPIEVPAKVVEGLDRPSAQTFLKNVYTFNRTRNNLVSAIQQDIDSDLIKNGSMSCKNALEAARNVLKCEDIRKNDTKNVNTPRMMWIALSDLAVQMKYLKPELATKYQVMAAVFGESVKPLTNLKADIPPFTSRNAVEATVGDILSAGKGISQAYDLPNMKKGEVRVSYEALENKAKAKMILHNALNKVTGLDINNSPMNQDPDESITELKSPSNMHEASLRCVTKAFLARAEKPTSTAEEIRGLTAVVESKGFQAQVKELEKNPIFRTVAANHPNHYYSKWQKILDNAETQKEQAIAELGHMSEAGGPQGLASYVAFGEQDAPLVILGNADQEQLRREVRLAKVMTAKLLSTPGLTTLRQAVGAGMIRQTDVAMEALDYIEKKGIRMVDRLGMMDRNFARMLENGDLQKDMIKSQVKFVAQAKNRNPEHKRVLQSKLNSVKKPEPRAVL